VSTSHHPFPYFASQTPKTAILGQNVLEIHANINIPIFALNIRESSEFPIFGVEEHNSDASFQTGNRNKTVLRMRIEKYAIQPLLLAEWAKFSRLTEMTVSLIMDSAMGQIPRSTERISCMSNKVTKLAATLRWFTAGGAIRIAVRQLSQTWKLRHYDVIDDVITRKL